MKRLNPLSTDFHIYLLIAVFFLAIFISVNHSKKINITICKNCNVVIIDIDMLRNDALDCENARGKTSNICSLLQESVYFQEHINHSDLTLPSFVSSVTSMYPSSHGVFNELYSLEERDIQVLPEVLRKEGYTTVIAGHVTGNYQVSTKGFDIVLDSYHIFSEEFAPKNWVKDLYSQGKPFYLHIYLDDLHFPYLLFTNKILENPYEAPERISRTREEYDRVLANHVAENYKQVFTQEAIDKNPDLFSDVKKNKEEIYWLFVKYTLERDEMKRYIKDAWKPTMESFLKYINSGNLENNTLYLKSNYLAIVSLVDEQLSEMLNLIKDSKLTANTIIIIKAEHGEEFFEHGRWTHGNNLYQELIHTPLVIRVPGLKPVYVSQPTQDIDLMPTILGLVGIPIPKQAQGKSLVPLMLNPNLSVRDYQIAQKGEDDYISAFRKGDWKVIIKEDIPIELYNLQNDPGEKFNLINMNSGIVSDLLKEYQGIVKNLPKYREGESPIPTWIDQEKRERLKEEGYF